MQDRVVDWKRLSVLIEASVTAGRYFAARVQGDKRVTQKTSAADVVTEVDRASEDIIRNAIQSVLPEDHILGEEGTDPGSDAAKAAVAKVHDEAHLWIIDPLDGTTNFVSRIPLSVVSLAYARQGDIILGAVYDPYRDELFYAVRGQGAFLASADEALQALKVDPRPDSADAKSDEGAPLQVGEIEMPGLPGTRLMVSEVADLRRSIVASGFPTRADDREQALRNGMDIVRKAKSLRGFGAAAMHLAYVAAGRLDGFWEYDLNAWDIAAGALLIDEAGGVVMDISGASYNLTVRNVIACGQTGLANEIRSQLSK